MNEKQIQSLIKNLKQAHRKKYPVIVIVLMSATGILASEDGAKILFPPAPHECEVLKIYDGDTMTLQCSGQTEKTKVRLYCIDTPEMRQNPWGTEARDHLRSIAGHAVKLIEVDKDRYGRIVGEVYNGEINLNLAQVQAGKAAVYDAYCKKSLYKEAEQQAKEAQLGIWAKPGIHQTPWEWRKSKR